MRKGNCPVCGQEMFDPLLNELKKKDSKIERLATEILNYVMDLINKSMSEVFPKHEVEAFDKLFSETKEYYNIRDMISMALMPEEG